MAPFSETSSSTSPSLLERVRDFDPAAWKRLTRLYGPVVYGWARQAGLQDSDASDVVQEVFQSVAANIIKFRRNRDSDTFRGWLWTITRNKVCDYFRGVADRPAAMGGTAQYEQLQNLPEVPPDTSRDYGRGEQVRVHQRALKMIEAEFPPHQWQAFLRTTVTGDSPADVAEDLEMSVCSVYQAKSRVLRRLRQELRDLIDF
jgi:RNA polymerase sigma-70 factor (ECF subfamily)